MKIENPHWKSHLEWSHNWPVTGCLSRRDSSDVVEKGKVVGRWRAQFLQDRQLPYCRNTNFRKLPQRVLRRKKLWRVSIFKDGLRLRKSSPTIKYVKISQNSNIRTSELKQIYNNICNIYIIYIYNIYQISSNHPRFRILQPKVPLSLAMCSRTIRASMSRPRTANQWALSWSLATDSSLAQLKIAWLGNRKKKCLMVI